MVQTGLGTLSEALSVAATRGWGPSKDALWRCAVRTLKRTVILLLAFSTALPGLGVAEDRGNVPQHGSTELAEVHPLVVVVTQTMKQIQAGNGFAVGDGGLVVTAYQDRMSVV